MQSHKMDSNLIMKRAQERLFVYNCSNMKIYSLFDISAIVFNDCSSEIQQKRHLVGSSRQLVLIKVLFYNGCTMS